MTNQEDLTRLLAGRLHRLREAAGLSGEALGQRVGWTQSKVSKIETHRTPPSDQDIAAWADATGASAEDRAELDRLLAALEEAAPDWRRKFHGGQALTQRRYDQLARKATVVRNFEAAVIPGLLQTAGYARARMMEGVIRQGANPDPAEVDRAVKAKLRRGQVLFEGDKRFEFLLAEPALRWRLASAEDMRVQLSRLLTLADVPNVTIAVLPFEAELPETPQHGFALFDNVATIETWIEEKILRGADAAKLDAIFTDLMAHAVTGAEAARLIDQAIAALPHPDQDA